MKNRGKNDFVLMFYNKFIKMPKLAANEWVEESKDPENDRSINKCMKEYVQNYLHTAQLLYNLMPLMACLGDDPYIDQFPEGQDFL